MQLKSTFGAFLVAVTMVHGAPHLVERHVGRTGNGTANANPSSPMSGFRGGGNGFKPGMMQGMGGNAPSADGGARNGGSDTGGRFDQTGGPGGDEDSAERSGSSDDGGSSDNAGSGDEARSGQDADSGEDAGPGEDTSSSAAEPGKRSEGKKVQERNAPRVNLFGDAGKAIAEAGSRVQNSQNSGRSLSGRQETTGQESESGAPQGDNTGSPGMPPGAQPNGGSRGPSRNPSPGNGGPGTSRNGSPQTPSQVAASKRQTMGV